MRVGARAGAKAGDRGRIARFRALSTRGGSFPHGARASDSGRRTTVERGTRSDPEAIGDHIPWREQPAEEQRACRGQPETIEPGACTSRNSSTPIAIKAAIAAITGRGRREVAIATSKKTIVPHARAAIFHDGRRQPKPVSAQGQAGNNNGVQRQAREIVKHRRASRRQLIEALFFVTARRRPPEASIRMRFPARNRAAGSHRHGRQASRARWPGPSRCRRCHAAS